MLGPATYPELQRQPRPYLLWSRVLSCVCFPGADSGPVLLALLEMCVCSSLSSATNCVRDTPTHFQELVGREGMMRAWPAPTQGPQEGRSASGLPSGAFGGPQDLCFAGPPCASSRLHVLCLVQRALLCDSPAPNHRGMWARVGGAALGGLWHCQHPLSWQDTTCKALGRKSGGREGTKLGRSRARTVISSGH